MAKTNQTIELKLKKGEDVSDYFDEADEDILAEFKDDTPVIEVIIKKENK